MRFFLTILLLVALASAGMAQVPGTAAPAAKDSSPHSEATLGAEFSTVVPGEEVTLALRIKLEPEWHCYWLNPGDAGMAASIRWQLPESITVGELQYPAPHYIPTPPLASYGYEDEVLLLMDARVAAGLKPGTKLELKGRADWLVCKEVCLPAREEIALTLTVGEEIEENLAWAPAIAKTRAALPTPATEIEGMRVRAARTEDGYVLAIETPEAAALARQDVRFFPQDQQVLTHAAPQERRAGPGLLTLSLVESEFANQPAERLRGVLTLPESSSWKQGAQVHAVTFEAPVEALGSIALQAATPAGDGLSSTLLVVLVSAFIGGMILNLMPCVFPVLSLKIMSFVQQAGDDRAKIRNHGFVFTFGVLASFWALAGLLLLLRAGGSQLGWGFQLQSPAFVAFVALLIFGLGLNLAGVFEVGMSLTRLGSAGGAAQGYGGSFFSGVLATAVATPCTAPFMGSALGYAIAQPATTSMLVFTALGAGMATPYMVLSLYPRMLSFLPRPGAWMETLKQVLSFPLFATAIWLLWVFGLQTGIDGAAGLLLAMLLLAIAGWIVGKWNVYAISGRTRLVTRATAILALAVGLGFAWNASQQAAPTVTGGGSGKSASAWQTYSDAKLEGLLASQHTVFVDFTAAWCLTCQVNKRTVLHRDAAMNAFAEKGVELLVADWTNKDPEIAAKIESLGRSGVPVYALYKRGARQPVLLPEILTEGILLEALADLPAKPVAPETLSQR
ncbi:MAG: thioredoxin family protein [Bryobacterales bacterium]|nr:thioredoxin family protein [Bryobacterales bacterium]